MVSPGLMLSLDSDFLGRVRWTHWAAFQKPDLQTTLSSFHTLFPSSLSHLHTSAQERPLTHAVSCKHKEACWKYIMNWEASCTNCSAPPPTRPRVEFLPSGLMEQDQCSWLLSKKARLHSLHLSSARQAGNLQPQHTLRTAWWCFHSCRLWQEHPERLPKVRPQSLWLAHLHWNNNSIRRHYFFSKILLFIMDTIIVLIYGLINLYLFGVIFWHMY